MFKGNSQNISVIILAAGYSRRMGTEKLFLKFDDKRNFLEKIVKEYITFGCRNIILVLNKENSKLIGNSPVSKNKKISIVINTLPVLERFFSVHLGSKICKKSEFTFIQNIDNPFVNVEILNKLSKNIKNFDIIVPEHNKKGGHPILLSPKVVDDIKKALNYKKTLREYLAKYNDKRINIENNSILMNINTPENYKRFFKTKQKQK